MHVTINQILPVRYRISNVQEIVVVQYLSPVVASSLSVPQSGIVYNFIVIKFNILNFYESIILRSNHFLVWRNLS